MNEYEVLNDRLYTKTHEWALKTNDTVIVGITDYAQKMLHEIVYIELPEVGKEIRAGEVIAEIESVKTVAEVYSPISGKIIKVNSNLIEKPDLINMSPYKDGWIVEISPINWDEEIKQLLSAEEYLRMLQKEH